MRALIASTFTPFSREADRELAEALRREFQARGHETELTLIPLHPGIRELPAQLLAMRLLDLRESNEDTVDLLVTIGLPATVLTHPRKVAWILDSHPCASPWSAPSPPPADPVRDSHIHQLARRSFLDGLARCARVYAGTAQTRDRLEQHLRATVAAILPPPGFQKPAGKTPGPAPDWDAIVLELTA